MAVASVVILGAGHAGFQTAASLRQEGFDGRIMLIGDEPGLPYQRPPLSKAYLQGKIGRDALCFRPEKFFAEQRIELLCDRAAAIDRRIRRVRLGSGALVAYDHLVLAVGARNRPLPVPGAALDGVFMLRSLADADALGARLREVRHVVVVGGGFIGLEFAAVASALGADVQVIELANRPVARAVSVEMAQFFAQAHARRGVTLHFERGLARIHGARDSVIGVETTDGTRLPAELVVIGIGVLPNVELAAEAGLELENGVKVGHDLLTADLAISAIGDCASFPDPLTGDTIRLESVQNATDHARTVAARLVGHAVRYAAVPWFWTEQADLELQMAGLVSGYDGAVTVGSPEQGSFSVLCFRKERLVAVESVNRPMDHMAARRLLARGARLPSPADAAIPDFELKAWEIAFR